MLNKITFRVFLRSMLLNTENTKNIKRSNAKLICKIKPLCLYQNHIKILALKLLKRLKERDFNAERYY